MPQCRNVSIPYPHSPLLLGQQIRLVDQQQALPLPLPWNRRIPLVTASLVDIRLEIDTSESKRVPRIQDLDDEVRTLEDTPQLAPKLDVAFERRKEEVGRLGKSAECQRRLAIDTRLEASSRGRFTCAKLTSC